MRREIESNIASNEATAQQALKSIYRIQCDFRPNDLDRNRVIDFWTGDIASLYTLEADGVPIRLIEKDLALADAAPLKPMTREPIPYHGYFIIAMERDESDCIFPSEDYKQDTDGKTGKVHNTGRFAFCAFPASYGKTGRNSFVITESKVVWRIDTLGKPLLRIPCQQPPPHEHGKRSPYDDRQ